MRSVGLAVVLALLAGGCSAQPEFVQVRPGVTVSSRLIDEYMEQNDASRAEAKAALAAEVMTSKGVER